MTTVQQSLGGLWRRLRNMTPRGVGMVVTVAVLLACLGTFEMRRITTTLSSGGTVQAEFSRAYKLQDYKSYVRIAGVDVGQVTGVGATNHGTVLVSMKVDDQALRILGSNPSASVHPTTILGGVYFVSLTPGDGGGRFDGRTIPVSRTSVPVELGQALSAFTPSADAGLQSTVRSLDATLRPTGRTAIKGLLKDAPRSLNPTGKVLTALEGTRPDTDLTELVDGLKVSAAAMTRQQGQLASIFVDLNRTTTALANAAEPLAAAISTMPMTLQVTRVGLVDLRGTLDRLTVTATSLQPTVRQLDSTLAQLDPVLVRARPVVADANALLANARPLVQDLVPSAVNATKVMTNIRGPVLDRVNGPIKAMVLSPWKGTGYYKGGGNGHLFYQELGYLAVNGDKVWQTHDHNGIQARLMAGVGLQTLGGGPVPMSLVEYLQTLGLGGR